MCAAPLIGTFALVCVGCGAIVIDAPIGGALTHLGPEAAAISGLAIGSTVAIAALYGCRLVRGNERCR
jgi:hypothetical protein